ncbi:hypothetical protein DFS34DRAFT_144869 [Phlyctochytrium arcticum]|nr:hypothetical protein DFS34DRAFT_144869 [Phlyctochytrium arcticum]
MASLIGTRNAQATKSLLQEPPSVVHAPEYDPRWLDLSQQHREYMRCRLYGKARDNLYVPKSNNEAGSHNSNYADEVPPQWQSTMKQDFIRKHVDYNAARRETKQLAADIDRSHFSLDGPDGGDDHAASRTKQDFPGHDTAGLHRGDPKDILKKYQLYPPIYCEENTNPGTTTYSTTFFKPKPQARPVISARHKSKVNISLGGDDTDYTTSTTSAYQPLPPIPIPPSAKPSNISHVLEGLDGEPTNYVSEAKEAGANIPENLNFNSLRPDMTKVIQDLRSTHFTLGNEGKNATTSHYTDSFQPHAGVLPNRRRAGVVPSHVLEEYDDDRKTGSSWSQSVYKNFGAISSDHQKLAEKMRAANKTSIIFGNEMPITAKSVTSTAYVNPTGAIKPAAITNAATKNPIAHDPETKTPQSVSQSTYQGVQDPIGHMDSLKQCAATHQLLRREHFTFGNEDCANASTSQRDAYQARDRIDGGMRAAGLPVGSRHGHELRMGNPDEALDYITTTKQTVGAFAPELTPAPPSRLFPGMTADHLQLKHDFPSPLGIGTDPRTYTTITRQSFVPPEVMRYTQSIEPSKCCRFSGRGRMGQGP